MPGDTRKTIQEQFEALQGKGLELRNASIAPASAIPGSRDLARNAPNRTNISSNPNEKIKPPKQHERPEDLSKLESENAFLLSERNRLKSQNEGLNTEIATIRNELREAIQTSQDLSSRATDIDAREKKLESDLNILAEQETHLIERHHLHEIEGRRLLILSDNLAQKGTRLELSLQIHEQELEKLRSIDEREKSVLLREAALEENEKALKKRGRAITSQEQALAIESAKIARDELKNKTIRQELRTIKQSNHELREVADSSSKESAQWQRKFTKAQKDLESARDALLKKPALDVQDWKIIEWMLWDAEIEQSIFSEKISCEGSGPWENDDLRRLLKHQDFKLSNCGTKDASEIVIVGRDDWDPEALERHILSRGDEPIYIFPQELFIASLLCGRNPFHELESNDALEILELFGNGHPVVEWLRSEQFPWPEIVITDSPSTAEFDQVEESPLFAIGYRVGKVHGLPKSERHELLTEAFRDELPFVESKEYMESWGLPGHRLRLQRIAWHLAMLIRSRRKNTSQHVAVSEWEDDLKWLKRNFYTPFLRFRWP